MNASDHAEAEELLEAGDSWTVEVDDLVTINDPVTSSLMALGNGYVGVRGDIGMRLDDANPRATILAGFHETWPIIHAENAYGFARTGQTLLPLPDATGFRVFVNGVRVNTHNGTVRSVRRMLDMHQGVLRQELDWESPSGLQLRFSEKFMVSIKNRHLVLSELSVENLHGDADIRVSSVVEESSEVLPEPGAETLAEITGMTDPRVGASGVSTFLAVVSRSYSHGDGTVVFRTERSKMMAALSYTHRVAVTSDSDHKNTPVTVTEDHDGLAILTHFDTPLAQGETITVSKALCYSRSEILGEDFTSESELPLPSQTTGERLEEIIDDSQSALANATQTGLQENFAEQAAEFALLWADHDIVLRGDSRAQKALRWTVFHLLQASALLDGTSISVKGLTGTGYDGHYFWDTEIYVLPFLNFTAPRSAHEALHYRYQLLDAARSRAARMSQKGALYPWRTINGHEASAYYPAGTAQYHIDADIAYAVDQYVRVTNDFDFMAEEGFEILVETARLWADLGFWDEGDERGGENRQFHIYGVTGPDEYTAVVDDNFYTNVMARQNLRNTLSWASWLDRSRHREYVKLRERLDLSDDELTEFRRITKSIHLPYDQGLGVHGQDRSFLSKPRWDFDSVPREHYPLLLNYHPLVIYRHQVIKQADVVLALYLSGEEFSLEQRRADFEYYDPLTTGDSSLSAASQAIVASDVGYTDLALDYFERALYVDLADLHGNANLGLHMASLGGVWSAAIMGFGGVRLNGDRLSINPSLPERWEVLHFRLQLRGQWLTIVARRDSVEVTLDADSSADLSVIIAGRPFSLLPGRGVDVRLRPEDFSVDDVEEEMGRFADMEPLELPAVEDVDPDSDVEFGDDMPSSVAD